MLIDNLVTLVCIIFNETKIFIIILIAIEIILYLLKNKITTLFLYKIERYKF